MPLRLASESPDFEAAFRTLLSTKTRGVGGRRRRGPRDPPRRSRRGRCGADPLLATLRQGRSGRARPPGHGGRGDGGSRRGAARGDGGAATCARSHHQLPRTPDAGGPCASPIRSASELGWRWTAIEAVGLYRSRRHGELPLLRADERRAGQGGRLQPTGDGCAGAGGSHQPAGARRRPPRRCRRDLPCRRCTGDRGSGLRHADDRRR